MRALIAVNGDMPQALHAAAEQADLVIACDGAAAQLLERNIVPDIIAGDMDSLPADLQEKYRDITARFSCQETNDQTKAFRTALGKGADSITVVGITGRREDHALGNLSLLPEYLEEIRKSSLRDGTPAARTATEIHVSSGKTDCPVHALTDHNLIIPVTGSVTIRIEDYTAMSIISMDPELEIESEGLQYPTGGIRLDRWWKATLNRITAGTVRLTFSRPAHCLIFLS